MNIKITGCIDCIFHYENDAGPGSTCLLALNILHNFDGRRYTNEEYGNTQILHDEYHEPITPKWCPLKNENVTVSY